MFWTLFYRCSPAAPSAQSPTAPQRLTRVARGARALNKFTAAGPSTALSTGRWMLRKRCRKKIKGCPRFAGITVGSIRLFLSGVIPTRR